MELNVGHVTRDNQTLWIKQKKYFAIKKSWQSFISNTHAVRIEDNTITVLQKEYGVVEFTRIPFPILVTDLFVEVTQNCNLKCRGCYCGKKQRNIMQKGVLQSIRTWAEKNELDVFNMHITGGEPLMQPELVSMLLNQTGYSDYITVHTNGTVWNKDVRDILDLIHNCISYNLLVHNTQRHKQAISKLPHRSAAFHSLSEYTDIYCCDRFEYTDTEGSPKRYEDETVLCYATGEPCIHVSLYIDYKGDIYEGSEIAFSDRTPESDCYIGSIFDQTPIQQTLYDKYSECFLTDNSSIVPVSYVIDTIKEM